jgi:hypothetical protein
MGQIEGQLVKQARATRQSLPARVANAPELLKGLETYYDAFHELSTCRNQGPIPWDAMVQYAHYLDLDKDEFEELNYFIRAMDKVYLEHQKKAIQHANAARPS